MTLLILGLVVWTAAHLFKRAAPDARSGLAATLGAGPSRGVMALAILAGLVLIIIGYRRAPFVAVYDPPTWGIHLNNLLMFFAVALMGAGQSKGHARALPAPPDADRGAGLGARPPPRQRRRGLA